MRTVILPLLVVAGFLPIGNSLAQSGRTVGNVVDDTTIAARVKAALVQATDVPGGSINIEVDRGHVQLAAFLESDAEIEAALAITRSIAGVSGVKNSMIQSPSGRSIGTTIDDQIIQGRLKAALVDSDGLGNAVAINTEVRRGHVLLSGFVSDEATKAHAEAVAREISGVIEVHNRIDVAGEVH